MLQVSNLSSLEVTKGHVVNLLKTLVDELLLKFSLFALLAV